MTAYNQIESNKRRTVALLALFILVIIGLGYVFSLTQDIGPAGLVLAVIIALSMSLVSYYSGDKIALFTSGAKGPISKEQNAYLFRLVENLCIAAGIKMPKIYVIPDSAINAFATGRDPEHASIAVTQGAISKLENEELEGVLAHELSHIKNYDIRLMMIVIVCVSLTTLLANWFFRFSFFSGHRNNKNSGQSGLILLLIGIILSILSPIAAKLIQLAISRKREYLADASAVLLTRFPDGLSRALKKISAENQPLIKANKATSHLYIANPFNGKKSWFNNMFSTHPPISDRIKALEQMA